MARLPMVLVVAVLTAALATTPRAAGQAPRSSPPDAVDAAGTKLLTTLCGSCHTRGSILATHRSKQDWEEVLEWMIDEGAVMSDDEFDQMLGYLSVRYGRVDINAAPAEDIRHVLELTQDQAERLVAARTAGRRFAAVKDVAEAAGVPVDFVEARKERIGWGG
jgi:mono/diheme cytochrome c family protein